MARMQAEQSPPVPGQGVLSRYLDEELRRIWVRINDMMDKYTEFQGPYVPGQCYNKGDIVVDGVWTMVALRDTCDRPAPQPDGAAEWSPQLEAGQWDADAEHLGVCYSGHVWTFTRGGWVNAVEVWVPELTADTNYRVVFVTTDAIASIEEPILNMDDWTLLRADPTPIVSGTVFGVYLDSLNSGGSTEVVGGWSRAGNDNNPIAPAGGQWNRNQQSSVLRIADTDLDTVNRDTELSGVIPGSTIQIADTGNTASSQTWYVESQPRDLGTAWEWDVTIQTTGPLGEPGVGTVCTITIDVPVAQTTKYKKKANHWPANNPAWATVEGFERLSGLEQPGQENHAFGVRIQFQPGTASPDWQILSYSG